MSGPSPEPLFSRRTQRHLWRACVLLLQISVPLPLAVLVACIAEDWQSVLQGMLVAVPVFAMATHAACLAAKGATGRAANTIACGTVILMALLLVFPVFYNRASMVIGTLSTATFAFAYLSRWPRRCVTAACGLLLVGVGMVPPAFNPWELPARPWLGLCTDLWAHAYVIGLGALAVLEYQVRWRDSLDKQRAAVSMMRAALESRETFMQEASRALKEPVTDLRARLDNLSRRLEPGAIAHVDWCETERELASAVHATIQLVQRVRDVLGPDPRPPQR